jgi:hypothetical protein
LTNIADNDTEGDFGSK